MSDPIGFYNQFAGEPEEQPIMNVQINLLIRCKIGHYPQSNNCLHSIKLN